MGYKTKIIIRDDGLEIGSITQIDGGISKSKYNSYQGSGSWMAVSSDGSCKYFVHYNNALKWLERKYKYIFPISRLAEFVNR